MPKERVPGKSPTGGTARRRRTARSDWCAARFRPASAARLVTYARHGDAPTVTRPCAKPDA